MHSKQLLPIYGKPMIYYPLSVLMQAGITENLVISAPEHLDSYRALLGDGERLGVSLAYTVQRKPGGIAEALVIGGPFADGWRGSAWFDTGTHDSLREAAMFVQVLEKRQGIRISCLEEVAYRMGYIDREQLALLGKELSPSSGYGQYVMEPASA